MKLLYEIVANDLRFFFLRNSACSEVLGTGIKEA